MDGAWVKNGVAAERPRGEIKYLREVLKKKYEWSPQILRILAKYFSVSLICLLALDYLVQEVFAYDKSKKHA